MAEIVEGCTEWIQEPHQTEADKPSWRVRKAAYLDHLRGEQDPSIVRVALADKLHNARSIVTDLRAHGRAMLTRFNAPPDRLRCYYRELVNALRERTGSALFAEFAATVDELVRSLPAANVVPQVVGVDGAGSGWVAVALANGEFKKAERFAALPEILAAYPDAKVIAVDIPIGLMESGPRAPDEAARKFLGSFRDTVFPTPPRQVIDAPTYQEALARSRAVEGRGISRQSYALRAKVLEVDACAREHPRIHEVHPEVSFRAMTGGGLRYKKKAPQGFDERRAALRRQGIDVPDEPFELRGVAADDVLDAAAAAWSGQRIAVGAANSLPEEPPRDEFDRPIAIWY